MEEGKEKNSEEGTSKEDKAMNGHGVEGTGVREVEEGERVGCPGPEGCRCTGEDSIVRNVL